jgi:hypothetical protein
MRISQVLKSLVELVDNPEPEHALRAELAEGMERNFQINNNKIKFFLEFTNNRTQFNSKAATLARNQGGKR